MAADPGLVGVPRSMLEKKLRRRQRSFSGLTFRSPIKKEILFDKFRIIIFLLFPKAFYMHLDPFIKHAHSMNSFPNHRIQKPLNILTNCHNIRILYTFFY